MIKQAEPLFTFNDFARLLFINRKQAGVYGLVFIVISFNLGLFLPANMHSPNAERMVNAVQLFCFAVMGVINVWLFYKRNVLPGLFFSGAKLAFILLLFVLMCLLLFIYYYVTGNNSLIMAFASSSAFLLPFIIYQGWVEYISIPAAPRPGWSLPQTEAVNANVPLSATNTMQLQLKISRKADDALANIFPVTASGKTRLGKVFERFINDRQMHGKVKAIEITDDHHQSFGWQFYEEKWFGFYNRYLNPNRSLAENNIKPNAKIVIIRIKRND